MIPDLLDSLPWSVHGAVALALLAGFVVWIFGRRLFRPMLVLAALVLGAAVGFVAGAALPHEWSILWPVGIGAAVAGLISIVAYRFVMALLLALSLGLAAPLGFFTYAELTGMYEGQQGSPISDGELLLKELREPRDTLDRAAEQLLERRKKAREAAENGEVEKIEQPAWRERLEDTVGFVLETAAQNWSDAPGSQKWMTFLFAAGGVIGGVVFGVLAPTLAASVVTSLAGSLIILTSGYWLATRSGLSLESIAPKSAAMTLALWLGVAVIGLFIQLSLGVKKADKG